MARAGDVIENPVTGQRLIFRVTSADSGGQLSVFEGAFPPGGFAGVLHVHPHQNEHFQVLAGHAAFDVAGARHVLEAGGTIDVPRGVQHTFANAGQEEMRVRCEFRPAPPSTERFYEIYFAFAQQGRVNAKAMPSLLDIATVWPITSEHALLARPPAVIQHALFRTLAPVARVARRRPPRCKTATPQTPVPN
jgi:quercetin dioxygenase-like cupin family protein